MANASGRRTGRFRIRVGAVNNGAGFRVHGLQGAGIDLEWRGHGEDEVGYCDRTDRALVRVNPAFFRPVDVEFLCGDSRKAALVLDWRPQTALDDICGMMLARDRERVSKGEWT